MRVLLLILVLLGISAERADACACCDEQHSKKVLGWSDAGGAVLIEATTMGCDPRSVLMVFPVGAKEASGCYDLITAPEKRVACDTIEGNHDPKRRAKASKIPKQFPKPGVAIEAARVKLRTKVENADDMSVRVKVDLDGKQVIDEVMDSVVSVEKVTAYANVRGDRALVLIQYTEHGNGNERVAVRWVELAKKP